MQKIIVTLGIGFVTLFIIASAQSKEMSLQEIVDNVQRVYDQTADLTADFLQEVEVRSLERTKEARGKVYLKKPGKMYWEYHSSNQQKIISDGSRLWLYFPEKRQVIVQDFTKLDVSSIPSSILTGEGRLQEEFNIRFALPEQAEPLEGAYLLSFSPKEKKNVPPFFLAIDKDSFQVVETRHQDMYGNLSRVKFQNIKVNQGSDDARFTFSLPEGVTVYENPSAEETSPPLKTKTVPSSP